MRRNSARVTRPSKRVRWRRLPDVTGDFRRHPIQAIEVRADRITAERRPRPPGKTDVAPTSHTPRVRLVNLAEDGLSFAIEVQAQVEVPLVDDKAWEASIRLTATFVSDVVIRRSDALAFANASGLFLVWPYARTYLNELARIAGVTAPLL